MLRATTTIAAALHHGATAVIPGRHAGGGGADPAFPAPSWPANGTVCVFRGSISATVPGNATAHRQRTRSGALHHERHRRVCRGQPGRPRVLAAVNFSVSVRGPADSRGDRGPAGGVRRPRGWLRARRCVYRGTLPPRRTRGQGAWRGAHRCGARGGAARAAPRNRWDRCCGRARRAAAIGLGPARTSVSAGRQDEFPVLAAMQNGRITGAT